jgi:hypothetical protein
LTKLTDLLDNVAMIVDRNALRFNQASLTLLVVIAFIVGGTAGTVLVALTGTSLLLAAAVPRAGPFGVLYRHVVLRLGILRPDRIPDDPAPHRFAQLLGGVFLGLATVLLALGAAVVGWILAAIVVVLALTNLVAGFCMGCFLFLQLARLGIIRRTAEA